MEKLKALFCFIICIGLIAFILPYDISAANNDFRYGKTILGQMNNSQSLLKIYDALSVECEEVPEEVDITLNTATLSEEEIKTAYLMFYCDYPEYYWLDGGAECKTTSNNITSTITIAPTKTMSKSQVEQTKSKFESKISALTNGLSGKSDYEKSRLLHDRLCDAVLYQSGQNDQNAYGALIEGSAVCNGYARAYQLLMQKAGIPAWYIRGNSTNPVNNNSVSHAWNMVKLNGNWYYTDVTWDDQDSLIFYTYLNVTSNQINVDHTADSNVRSYLPNATATDANFFVREDRVFSSFDKEKIVNLLKENKKTQIYVTYGVNEFISDYNININYIADALDAYNTKFNFAMLGNGIMLSVDTSGLNSTQTNTQPQINIADTPSQNPSINITAPSETVSTDTPSSPNSSSTAPVQSNTASTVSKPSTTHDNNTVDSSLEQIVITDETTSNTSSFYDLYSTAVSKNLSKIILICVIAAVLITGIISGLIILIKKH